MSAQIIDITKYIKKAEKPIKLPRVYNLRIELSKQDDMYVIEYDISNKKVRETMAGKKMLMDHLLSIVLSMCYDDPALIVELYESIEEYLNGEPNDL